MRHIDKKQPLPAFISWTRKNAHKRWDDVPPELRKDARERILNEEQHGWSAYTERRLAADTPTLHVDHFRKRSLFNTLTLDWDNLLVDEHNSHYGADHKDRLITKGDYDYVLNPVTDRPQHYIAYLANGQMVPREGLSNDEQQKALRTIEVFNLNHAVLVAQRGDIVKQILSIKGQLTPDQIMQTLIQAPFPSLIEYICKRI